MEKSLKKSEQIKKAVEAYNNDAELSYRAAANIHGVSPQSIINHLKGKNQPAPDTFITSQKLTPIEESVLVRHSLRAYESGFPLSIKHLDDCANEILRNRGSNERIGYHWHNSFLKRHPELKPKYSRPIDRQRTKAEDPDQFIE